ncbi:carbohydrate porin [Beijerinckia sp. L45]|uniref:carbohydrate porin n=1 Tax=Beijerinckia sp. L45 TaxID=1641855 RepID=UPI001FEFF5AF|nr:carbohydrate porin [Beijerinckia sp. L45]
MALLAVASCSPAFAQSDAESASKAPVATPATSGGQGSPPPGTPSIQSSLGNYGDPGGIRAFLDAKGIDFAFTYIGEVLGNTSGGVKRGATYEGRLDATLDVDLEKLASLKGAALHAEAFQIHGRGLSGNNTMDLFTVSGIEAYPSTRLYEAWFEQKFADDKIAVRVGQLGADTEFFVSQTSTLFVSSTYGWPAITADDLPSGGPAYPLSALGTRIKVTPFDNFTVLAAIFDGDPAGPYRPGVNNPLPQVRDNSGTNFRLQDPPLVMTEAAYAYNQEKSATALPGTVKVGYFHHFGQFAALDTPITTTNYRGNDGLYGVIDQAIYRAPGTDDQGASTFLRIAATPSDRNSIDFYVDGGVSYKGLIPGRPDDTAGFSAAYGRSSPNLAQTDALTGALVHDYQALIEATYQIAILPGFTIQPDFQYIFHPGAHGVADPATGLPIRDAAIFGLRATAHY